MALETHLELRVRRLEQQVRTIQSKINVNPLPPDDRPLPPAASVKSTPPPEPAVVTITEPAGADKPAAPPPPTQPMLSPAFVASTPSSLAYQPKEEKPLLSNKFEEALGLKWAGWIGAVVLIIGGVLGVKLIYDNGWFSTIPAWLRLASIFGAGLSLVGLGEWVLRKVHPIPAACLFGSGVAALFVAGYTGNAYFELYSVTTAQVAMLLATLVGAAIAVRANMVSIGVLALIGGNLAPLIVGRRDASVESFLVYLLTLQTVALLLASLGRGGKWWTLRGLSLGTMTLWIGTLLGNGHHTTLLPITMLISAGGFYLELILTSLRREPNQVATQTGTIFSLFLAAALTAGGLCYWSDAGRLPRTEWVLLLTALFGMSGALLPKWREGLSALAKSHRLAAVALLVLSAPVALSGESLLIGWTMLAVLLAAVYHSGKSTIARYASAGTWFGGLAYATILMVGRFGGGLASFMRLLGDGLLTIHFPSASVGTLLIAVAGFVVARLLIVDEKNIRVHTSAAIPETIVALATLAIAITAWVDYRTEVGAAVLIAIAMALLMTRRWLQPLQMAHRLLVLLLVAFVRLAWGDVCTSLPIGHATHDLLPILNLRLALYAGVAGCLAALYHFDGSSFCRNARGKITVATRSLVHERFVLGIAGILAWAFSAESLRLVGALHRPAGEAWHLISLLLSSVWLTAALTAGLVLRHKVQDGASPAARSAVLPGLVIFAALKYMTIDTVAWRLFYSPLTDGFAQMIEAVSAAILVAMSYLMSRASDDEPHGGFVLLSALLVLWAGSMQFDRAILGSPAWISFTNPHLALLVALSIFWALLAVAAVIAGFAQQLAALRYFGLGLLGVTLMKVTLIDLSTAGTGYRIVSFIGLGAVLIFTSMVYGKITPRLRTASN